MFERSLRVVKSSYVVLSSILFTKDILTIKS